MSSASFFSGAAIGSATWTVDGRAAVVAGCDSCAFGLRLAGKLAPVTGADGGVCKCVGWPDASAFDWPDATAFGSRDSVLAAVAGVGRWLVMLLLMETGMAAETIADSND